MKRRILTIQVEIADHEQAAWIWATHMSITHKYGIYVTAIHEGPIDKVYECEDADD